MKLEVGISLSRNHHCLLVYKTLLKSKVVTSTATIYWAGQRSLQRMATQNNTVRQCTVNEQDVLKVTLLSLCSHSRRVQLPMTQVTETRASVTTVLSPAANKKNEQVKMIRAKHSAISVKQPL